MTLAAGTLLGPYEILSPLGGQHAQRRGIRQLFYLSHEEAAQVRAPRPIGGPTSPRPGQSLNPGVPGVYPVQRCTGLMRGSVRSGQDDSMVQGGCRCFWTIRNAARSGLELAPNT